MKTKLVLVGFVLAIAYTCTTIVVLPQAHAFPCSGGSGKDYCSGYHKGAVQADKDFANPGTGPGEVFDSKCPSGHTHTYCDGWTRGYDDEAKQLD
jgi:hypothetical protein